MHVEEELVFQAISPQNNVLVVSSPGNRASEGRDRPVGEDALLGGHAGGVRGPVLSLLVQSLHRSELQADPHGADWSSNGRHHRGGHHRDSTSVMFSLVQSRCLLYPSQILYNFYPLLFFIIYAFLFLLTGNKCHCRDFYALELCIFLYTESRPSSTKKYRF